MRLRCDLRERRRRKGLSIRAAEAKTGVSRAYLSLLERGHYVPPDREVARLERVYGPAAGWFALSLLPDEEAGA